MPAAASPRCLTRVMIDDDCAVEVAQLQSVMQRIQCMLHDIPASQREYIANALLNLAISRMLREAGHSRTASILQRLGDVVGSGGEQPPPERAVDLTGLNG